MKKRLLEFLCCPRCRSDFDCRAEEIRDEEIVNGVLLCRNCEREHAIVNAIPRILPDRLPDHMARTAKAFGYEWKRYRGLYEFYKPEFLDYICPIKSSFFKDKVILDAGCGSGRYACLSSEFGASDIVGVDISESVEAAYENTKNLPNVHIIQADIYNLPLKAKFDYIYSLGVLHHLPDPGRGFNSLLRSLKKKGNISICVYGQEHNEWIKRFIDPLRIDITSRLPRPVLYNISKLIACLLYPLIMFVYKPINEVVRLKFLRPFLFYNEYLYQQSKYPFHYLCLNIFDHLSAPLTHYIAKGELRRWLRGGRLQDVRVIPRNRNSWRAHGVKYQ